ncbi:hypothetical protein [Dyella sp. 333MFSha]|uniref:hypothetical protein n=1 Tax=Dyella sp. 333MFSha TaxID=1798240 RepID=UPI00088C6C44|nr:hypothetical protein [Dyella sp. 333MFSha]SDF26979.1 hypothetical protein SAMN04515659_0551 [Dyella sp. 333MFSha]
MAIVSEIDIDDEILELTLTTGERIELRLERESVRVVNSQEEEIGHFEFAGAEGPGGDMTWRLINMFLEGKGGAYKRQGIGSRAVRFFLWANSGDDFEITENEGIRKDDGSHLTEDGPAFMKHLATLKADGKLFE